MYALYTKHVFKILLYYHMPWLIKEMAMPQVTKKFYSLLIGNALFPAEITQMCSISFKHEQLIEVHLVDTCHINLCFAEIQTGLCQKT